MNDKEATFSRLYGDNQDTAGLKDKSISGGIWIMAGQAGGHSLRILSLVVLARLLTPADYGLFAMVAVLINFIQMFKDIGLNAATIQSKEISHAQVSNLFWCNAAISLMLGLIVAASSPLVAWFYDREELFYITLLLSTTFPISGLIVQHIALLQRRLRYRDVSIIQIASVVVGIASGIIAAYAGLGYWALVIMELSGVICTTVFALVFCPWIPSLPDRTVKIMHFLRFGGYLMGSYFFEYISNNVDKLLIGKYLNPAILGQYTKASDLSFLPVRKVSYPLVSLGVSTLSRLQDEPERYRRYYLFAQETLIIALGPFFALGFVCSRSLFNLFLGSQWLEAAPIFSWFCILTFATAATSATRWLFISQARTRAFFYYSVLSCIVSCLSFILTIRYGIMVLTITYAAVTVLFRTPLSIIISARTGPVGVIDQIRCIIPTTILSVIMVLLIKAVLAFTAVEDDMAVVGIGVGVYFCCFVGAFILSKSWRYKISRLMELFFKKIKIRLPRIFAANLQ